ncbi:MAG: FtsP/CotA-like multicopper oxidase with cupredoxin domain [Paracoccaceae bacterium]|jgi:FtsP/CotA-like multicopper oxidase with cupredoxin domain
MMQRRDFVKLAGAASLMPSVSFASSLPTVLRAEPVRVQILPEGDGMTDLWGYNGGSPGPEIRIPKGGRVKVDFRNRIDQGTAVHWHGIRIENRMDGVPGMTQPLVMPGASFGYDFVAPDAGTYWYHSHNRSWEQVAKGLYGPLIIEETTPPDVDHDITVVIDDWRVAETGALADGFGTMHDQAHGGRLGNFARALFAPDLTVKSGARVRLRLINVATARVFPLQINGIEGVIVALDGMPLDRPEPLRDLVIAPAQRIDIIADVTAQDADDIRVIFPTRQEPYEMGRIPVRGTAARATRGPVPPLEPNAVPVPDMAAATPLTLEMQGGAMGRMRMPDGIWAFNGKSIMDDIPLHRFSRGETARISLINDTAFAHGIHLHGHHFHELRSDGTLGALRDTSLVARAEQRDIVCVFDNPGKWLLHCHMLDHQAAGMKTWIEVT